MVSFKKAKKLLVKLTEQRPFSAKDKRFNNHLLILTEDDSMIKTYFGFILKKDGWLYLITEHIGYMMVPEEGTSVLIGHVSEDWPDLA